MVTNKRVHISGEPHFQVIWLDDDLLVVNKPAGVPVLPDGWDPQAPFLRELLEGEYGRLWVVHRLDRETSGVLLLARTAEAHRQLNRQFEQRTVVKIYHALVTGSPQWERKTVSLALRANVGHKHRTVVDQRAGKAAQTDLRVLKRFGVPIEITPAPKGLGQVTLVEAIPHTGRTHQVRVHLAACGHSILGDRLYYSSLPIQLPGLDRLALHARAISFQHPGRNEVLNFVADYPADLATILGRLRQPGT